MVLGMFALLFRPGAFDPTRAEPDGDRDDPVLDRVRRLLLRADLRAAADLHRAADPAPGAAGGRPAGAVPDGEGRGAAAAAGPGGPGPARGAARHGPAATGRRRATSPPCTRPCCSPRRRRSPSACCARRPCPTRPRRRSCCRCSASRRCCSSARSCRCRPWRPAVSGSATRCRTGGRSRPSGTPPGWSSSGATAVPRSARRCSPRTATASPGRCGSTGWCSAVSCCSSCAPPGRCWPDGIPVDDLSRRAPPRRRCRDTPPPGGSTSCAPPSTATWTPTGRCTSTTPGPGWPAQAQVRAHHDRLLAGLYSNPHSENPTSAAAGSLVESARRAVLDFFHADPAEYAVVFTPNASGACRLVGEAYDFGRASPLVLTWDNHNSVNGIREYARAAGAAVRYVPLSGPELRVAESDLAAVLDAGPRGLAGRWGRSGPPRAVRLSGAEQLLRRAAPAELGGAGPPARVRRAARRRRLRADEPAGPQRRPAGFRVSELVQALRLSHRGRRAAGPARSRWPGCAGRGSPAARSARSACRATGTGRWTTSRRSRTAHSTS